MNDQTDHRTLLLGTLLQLESDLRRTRDARELAFVTVNATWNLIPYRQMVFWWPDALKRPALVAASGLAQLTDESPYCLWMRKLLGHLQDAGRLGSAAQLTQADFPETFAEGWQEWMAAHLLAVPLRTAAGRELGGLLLTRETSFSAEEAELIGRVAETSAHALWAFRPTWHDWHILRLNLLGDVKRRRAVIAGLLAVLLFPVHQSAIAPAQIIGDPALLIAAPMDGTVRDFDVKPNQKVAKGQLIFTLDDTALRNRRDVAEKALETAQADYLRAAQKAFSDDQSRAELAALKGKIDEKNAELSYLDEMLARIRVRAPRDGIVVFSDANDWIGKPVQTGERVVSLADPRQVAVQVMLPVDDAINLDTGAAVKVFLNAAPLHSLAATLTQTSYEAVPTPDGYMAYPLRARLADGEGLPRIGLKGSAKIYGNRVPFVYYLLRRPLAALRHKLGI